MFSLSPNTISLSPNTISLSPNDKITNNKLNKTKKHF